MTTKDADKKPEQQSTDESEFQLVRAQNHTYYSQLLPYTSERYKALETKPDSVIEISPEAHKVAGAIAKRIGTTPNSPTDEPAETSSTIRGSAASSQTKRMPQSSSSSVFEARLEHSSKAKSITATAQKSSSASNSPSSRNDRATSLKGGGRISQSPPSSLSTSSLQPSKANARPPSGAALIFDYGQCTKVPGNSLRGIRSHKLVSPFSSPGLVDLSADVDFTALADAALDASPTVAVHGPVTQAAWLKGMRVEARAEALAAAAPTQEKKQEILQAWQRLVDVGPNGMGGLYKVMAIMPHNADGDVKGEYAEKDVVAPPGFRGE